MPGPKLEQVSFAQGIISDASPVATPEGAILRACNYDIQKNGAAYLRPPLRREGVTLFASAAGASYCYVWDAPDGDTTKQFVICQVGTTFRVLRRSPSVNSAVTNVTPSTATHSRNILDTATVSGVISGATIHATSTQRYCVISGISMVSGGTTFQECVLILEYRKETGALTSYFDHVWMRDFFGYEDTRVAGARSSFVVDDNDVMYNLFNQGWDAEASGAGYSKYVIRSFLSSSGGMDDDAVCLLYTHTGGGAAETVPINGAEAISGAWSGAHSKLYITASGLGICTITGINAHGYAQTETVTFAYGTTKFSARHYRSVSSITWECVSAETIKVGFYYRLPGDYDNWTLGVYQSSATVRSFNPAFLTQVPEGTGKAPLGNYIIPANYRALTLGSGSMGRATYLYRAASIWADYSWSASLTADRSGRPHKVGVFAGRFWYSMTRKNCSSESTHGKSPDIASYVFFSRLVDSVDDITTCYQTNNPTSPEFNELLPDDGGFIRLVGAGEVLGIEAIANGVLVFCTGGVWLVSGGNSSVFTADAFVVSKLTEEGCVSSDSIVRVQDSVAYVSASGISLVGMSEGGMSAQSITSGKNEALFDAITDPSTIKAAYDSANKRAHFLYTVSGAYTKEIILDVSLGCVYTRQYVPGSYAILGFVHHSTARIQNFSSGDRCPNYGYILGNGTNVYIGYVRYDDTDGVDYSWQDEGGSYASVSEIFIGHISAGDLRLKKFCSYLESFLERTESTYTVSSGEATLNHQSSCKVQAYWEWSDTSGSQYTGQDFQVYMYRRPYLAESSNGTYSFDYGQSVISTRTRLRGNGKTLALKFYPESGKDCRILGWCVSVRGVE